MAGTVNKALLIGNLGRDPEIRQTTNGQKVANFPIATSEQWTDKQSGERRERTEWHRIAVFDNRLVDLAEKYLRKGSKIYLEGKIQTRKWQGQDGQDRFTTEIVLQNYQGVLTMLDSRQSQNNGGNGNNGNALSSNGTNASSASNTTENQSTGGTQDDIDDDIPF